MMTEQEIIEYLKENGTRGVAFGFMPEEVKEWCREHSHEPIFQSYLTSDIWTNRGSITCKDNTVYSLYE